MKSIQKYLKKKTADGTVSKAVVATLLLFNLAYFTSLFLVWAVQVQAAGGKKLNFNFLKDVADPRTYFYIIASSIISAILISSFIFHKIKAKRLNFKDDMDLSNKAGELLLSDEKKDKIEKVTIELENNGIMIMPNKNVIEIPVLQHEEVVGYNYCYSKSPTFSFQKVTFTAPSFPFRKDKSIYPEVKGYRKAFETMYEIRWSEIDFFNRSDFEKYKEFTFKYENNTVTFENNTGKKCLKNGEFSSVIIKPTKSFEFTDLYNINSIKIHYTDCSSTEVKLKLKEEQAVDMDKFNALLDYVDANRPHPLSSIKEPQVAFIPAIAGNRPIFNGGLYKSIPTGVSV